MPKKKEKKANLKVLRKNSTLLIRQEYMDYDYVEKLSPEDKQWLADFTDEYYNASVGKQSDKGKNNRFMKSKQSVKECQTNNNKRNNDVYGKLKAKNSLVSISNTGTIIDDPNYVGSFDVNKDLAEDCLIEILDRKQLSKSDDDTNN